MNDYKYQTFKTLDNPSRILFWKIDEFFVLVAPVFLAIALGSFLISLGVLFKLPYNKLKKKFSSCSLLHYTYWYLPTEHMRHLKRMPPSHQREFIL